jgi:hypothetical protein
MIRAELAVAAIALVASGAVASAQAQFSAVLSDVRFWV